MGADQAGAPPSRIVWARSTRETPPSLSGLATELLGIGRLRRHVKAVRS